MQTAIVIVIVALCGGVLLRRAFRAFGGRRGAGGCDACPAKRD